MAHPPLVDRYIQIGERIISALDTANFDVMAAFWWFSPEDGRWKFIIATPRVLKDGPRSAYSTLFVILSGNDELFRQYHSMDIELVDPRDARVIMLDEYFARNRLQAPENVSDTGSQRVVMGRSIEGAFVYRLPQTAHRRENPRHF
jgi:hypothetical protein